MPLLWKEIMKRLIVQSVDVTGALICDRCGIESPMNGSEFHEFTSIGYVAGYGSIFGDGNRVEIDLCQCCLREALGDWLRVTEPARPTRLATMLQAFDPEQHGGEFPPN